MTADEIMIALRHTAMSRINTPEQQVFCDALAEMFARVFEMQPGLPVEAKLAAIASVEVITAPKSRKKAH